MTDRRTHFSAISRFEQIFVKNWTFVRQNMWRGQGQIKCCEKYWPVYANEISRYPILVHCRLFVLKLQKSYWPTQHWVEILSEETFLFFCILMRQVFHFYKAYHVKEKTHNPCFHSKDFKTLTAKKFPDQKQNVCNKNLLWTKYPNQSVTVSA